MIYPDDLHVCKARECEHEADFCEGCAEAIKADEREKIRVATVREIAEAWPDIQGTLWKTIKYYTEAGEIDEREVEEIIESALWALLGGKPEVKS